MSTTILTPKFKINNMKKITLALLLLVITISANSQTKIELESYITTYIEAYPQNQGVTFHEQNLVTINGNSMTYSNVMTDWAIIFSYKFDLSKVNNIILDETSMKGKNIECHIYFVPGYKCEKMIYSAVDDKTETTFENKATIIISGNSKSDGMNLKIKEWLKKLCQLNGARFI
jgi:hypothetical protein